MFQRLLLTLIVLSFAGAGFSQSILNSGDPVIIYNPAAGYGTPSNPADSALNDNLIKKWIYSPTQKFGYDRLPSSWDKSRFKCYKVNNMNFRLRYPNNYDSTNPGKYPVVVFWHGGGEVGVMHENQDHLFWGAQLYEQRINAGEWNGFLLFPQEKTIGFDMSHFQNVNIILDSLQKSCAADLDKVIHMGLSEGGYAGVAYSYNFPQRSAMVVVSNAILVGNYISTNGANSNDHNMIDSYLEVPIWVANGGVDGGPNPYESLNYMYKFKQAGGNIFQTYYPTQGHGSWTTQWTETDIFNKYILSTWWNNASKAEPIVYFNNTQFCTGQPISAKMGITAGFFAYEWQMDNGGGFTTVGTNSNTYTATQAGKYRVHFKRTSGSAWSAFSPNPVVISTKACALSDTLFAEHFDESPVAYQADIPYKDLVQNSPCYSGSTPIFANNGIFTMGTEVFTQDATGVQGGRFMLNATDGNAFCVVYGTNAKVWGTVSPVSVLPNTNYTFTYYLGNQATTANATSTLAKIIPTINGVSLGAAPDSIINTAGNVSWKKISYNWNSGSATTADLALLNANKSTAGNDFVLDEISLTKAKPVPAPGGVSNNLLLWSKAGSLKGADNSAVAVWNNEDVNSTSINQTYAPFQPTVRNGAANNINFNPVVAFNNGSMQYLQMLGGFSGTATHQGVHAYVVMNSTDISQYSNMLSEGQAGGNTVTVRLTATGNLLWQAGSTQITASAQNEVNKPLLWSFSKDALNHTGSGNIQDIRKNGLVVASTNTGTSFTGNNSTMVLGSWSGGELLKSNIAEVVYYLDANINATSQSRIESYLALKYGTTLGKTTSVSNYLASDGSTIFWNGNSTYQNDVFGIGTDSLSGLVQKISNSVNSGSGDGTGQFAKGNLVLSTNANLADKSFLMIGNDAAPLVPLQTINAGANNLIGAIRVGRFWKVNNTNNVGAVDLSFDTTGLGDLKGGALLSNYSLVIDNDGDGNLATGVQSVYPATSAPFGTHKIIFSGVVLNNNVAFTIVTVPSPNVALPAIWLGFNAVAKNDNALLSWQTSDEINVDHYSVEHSLTGVNFLAIGSVKANNNTGINNYNFTHASLPAGVHYYRINRVDRDAKSEYSVIRTVTITNNGASIEVRPNPVVGTTLTLAIGTQQKSRATIHILSVDGKIIQEQTANLVQGTNLININVAALPSGVYMVQMILNDEVVTKKFVRQH